jgi:sigma-E factor negative regulatory protein RseC
MIETSARVVRVEGGSAWVCAEPPSSCGACGGKGCGASLYARLLHPHEPEYAVDNPIQARPGEAVVVGIEDGDLFKAALTAYLLPLALLVAGALLGMRWGEAYAIAGAMAGLLLSVVWLRRRNTGRSPVILRRGTIVCGPRPS